MFPKFLKQIKCNFTQLSLKEVKSEISSLNIQKSSSNGCTSVTILGQGVDIYLLFLTNAINKTFLDSYIPDELKKVEIIPVYKKQNFLNKEI